MRYKKTKSSVIRQKGKYQGGDYMKTKHAKFSEKRTVLTPWYVPVQNYYRQNGLHEKKKKKFVSMAPNTVLKEHRKEQLKDYNIKGTLMQIWKSPSMFLFI